MEQGHENCQKMSQVVIKCRKFRRFLKGWFPKGWFLRMCPCTAIFFLLFGFLRFGSSALSPSLKGESQTKCSPSLEVCCASGSAVVGCGHSLECGGGGGGRGSEGVDIAPRAESSRHDGTTCVPSGGTAVPREVRRYHPCTLRRYDGTTPVP